MKCFEFVHPSVMLLFAESQIQNANTDLSRFIVVLCFFSFLNKFPHADCVIVD